MKTGLLSLVLALGVGMLPGTSSGLGTPARQIVEQVESDYARYLGSWSGTVDQPGYGKYPVTILLREIEGQLSGKVNYPGLTCGGSLSNARIEGDALIFVESISGGNCISGGVVTLVPKDNKILHWKWFDPATGRLIATGELTLDAEPVKNQPPKALCGTAVCTD